MWVQVAQCLSCPYIMSLESGATVGPSTSSSGTGTGTGHCTRRRGTVVEQSLGSRGSRGVSFMDWDFKMPVSWDLPDLEHDAVVPQPSPIAATAAAASPAAASGIAAAAAAAPPHARGA